MFSCVCVCRSANVQSALHAYNYCNAAHVHEKYPYLSVGLLGRVRIRTRNAQINHGEPASRVRVPRNQTGPGNRLKVARLIWVLGSQVWLARNWKLGLAFE